MKTSQVSRMALVAIPWLIILGMIAGAYLPIFRGTKYLLPVKPRDPRDFFRGNYVDLQYEFSNLNAEEIPFGFDKETTYRFGDTLFLDMKPEDGKLTPVALYDNPQKVKHIKLKVQSRWLINGSEKSTSIVSGMESFFAPKTDAEAWENALRDGKVFAEVAIDNAGNARLVRLIKTDG